MAVIWQEIVDWFERRLPVKNTLERHLTKHPVPSNTNIWYLFGALAIVIFIVQIVSGIWLMTHYDNSAAGAFASIEYIMRDVDYGWLLRYMHSTGASAMFALVYLHIFRGLLYGSYRKPRELVWLFGMVLYLALMAEGFLGYVLPFGQMSYWAAQVIVSLIGAIPLVGEDLVTWVRGDYVISGITLSRFLALHAVVIPLMLIGVVVFHIIGLHEVGAGNPEGTDIESKRDKFGIPVGSVPFFPYKVLQAIFATGLFLILFSVVLFFAPEFGGYFLEKVNFEPAQPLKTPEHIVPVWYYTPFYAMLRATTFNFLFLDAKFWGLIVMLAAILIIALLPWLDRSPVASIRYKGIWSKVFLGVLVVSFVCLGYLGVVAPSAEREAWAQIFTLGYFSYFLLMPIYTAYEKTKPPPENAMDLSDSSGPIL